MHEGGKSPWHSDGQMGLPFTEMAHQRRTDGAGEGGKVDSEMPLTVGYESVLGWCQRLGNPRVGLLVIGLLIGVMSLISRKVPFLSPVSEVPAKYLSFL